MGPLQKRGLGYGEFMGSLTSLNFPNNLGLVNRGTHEDCRVFPDHGFHTWRCGILTSGFRVWCFGFKVQAVVFRSYGAGFRIQASGFRVQAG